MNISKSETVNENTLTTKPRILIIDDEVDYSKLTAKRVKASGYEVECYFQGQGAVEAIQSHQPDLILLDIKLPVISGIDIYKKLRAHDELKDVPVIFLSAMHHEESYCLNILGAEGFLTKPYDPTILLNTIKQVLKDSKET